MSFGFGRTSKLFTLPLTIDITSDQIDVSGGEAASYTNGALKHHYVEVWYNGLNLSRTDNQDDAPMVVFDQNTGKITFDPPVADGETISIITSAKSL